MTKEKTCAERVKDSFESTIETLTNLWESYQKGEEHCEEECSNMYEYGLSFDYVAPEDDEEEGYFRYQLSWGGPSDEFRFYTCGHFDVYKVDYWFMDWYDGARFPVHGDSLTLMKEIFEWFKGAGTVEAEYEKAVEV